LAEEAPGPSLTKEEAIARSEEFLREEKKIDLAQWSLVESNSDKRPHRTDHILTWQQKEALDGGAPGGASEHAYARMEVMVLGDEVTNYRTYVKIPDEWKRKLEENSLVRIVLGYGFPIVVIGVFGVTALIVFLKNLRSAEARTISWKRLATWGLWGLGGYILAVACGSFWRNALNGYRTDIPMRLYFGVSGISVLLGVLFSFGFLVLLFGVAWYYGVRAFGEERVPVWSGMPGVYYRDALFIALGGTAGWLGLDALSKWGYLHWPSVHLGAAAGFGAELDATVPALAIMGNAVRGGLTLTAAIGLTAAFIAGVLRPIWMRAVLLGGAVLALGGFTSNWHDPMDVAKKMVIGAVWILTIDLAVRYVIRFNLLGYFLILASLALLGGAAEMLKNPERFYQLNGYALVAGLVALLAWPVVAWRRRVRVAVRQ
jgi:hypothetical protein